MAEKSTPVGKVTETASPERVKGSMGKVRQVPSPKKALQGSVMGALKLPGLRKVLHTLAFARLMKVLRAIVGFVGIRALPVVALILGGWLFRRSRRRR
ncbi:hypothetical protein [Actinoallomurus iriomotensis]|uniref:Uncharacterized protein n=1 Tax=Actinoallomurus iriomotensis TaxID=478107 RepID=A0A9W6VPW8_9ACTN|nr:hypothetical protein [Actinoallomurus iriomotensis]GLY74016.1 hypothetical protein Airi01_022830 [Actinoallomurus iriomotensis]